MEHFFQIEPQLLQLDKNEIYRVMGYNISPPENIIADTETLINEAYNFSKIKVGYIIYSTQVLKNKFQINNITFDCGKIIQNQINQSEKITLFLATLGENFDTHSSSYFKGGDPYKGFIFNSIGSVLVESAIDYMTTHLEAALTPLKITNRFSPGYCNWDVKEQHKLFTLFPKNFPDVKLLPSSLMVPVKSVSGIIGVGKKVKKNAYSCNICNQKNCIMRKTKEIK